MTTGLIAHDGSRRTWPIDLAFRSYLLVIVGLIVLFGLIPGDQPRPLTWIGYHLLVLAVGWGISLLPRWWDNALTRFLRWWYPLIILYACFKGIGGIIHLIQPAYLDAPLLAADRFLFGTDVTLWMQARAHPLLTELMYFFYTSYYFLPLVVGVPLYRRALRSGGVERDRSFREFVFAVTVTFWVCYIHFLVTPAGGPIFYPAYPGPVLRLPGGPITVFEQWMFHTGGMVGGAFPSSHVAATFVMAFYAVRHRIVPRTMVVIAVGLAVSTMYNGYHYGVDVLYGMLVATVMMVAAPRLFDRLERRRIATADGTAPSTAVSADDGDGAATGPASPDAGRSVSAAQQVEEGPPEHLTQHAE